MGVPQVKTWPTFPGSATVEGMTTTDELLLMDALAHLTGNRPEAPDVRALPIDPGVSGVPVARFEVVVGSCKTVRLVTKPCGLTERRTLAALDGLAPVPRAFVPDTALDELQTVVMTDAGETLLAFDPSAKRRAAQALSEVHARFLGRSEDLPWLPRLDHPYLDEFIVAWCWRRAWDEALTDERFTTTFGKYTEAVEASAHTLAGDLLAFEARANVNTLAHTDVYHGHVFDQSGRAVVIDWGQARYAPLFLDLGDTFDTPEAAHTYREALAARGVELGDRVFQEGHLLARRFAGLRYLWWWLASWRGEPQGWSREGLERTLKMAAGEA